MHGFKGERVLMRIHIGERDRYNGKPLYQQIVELLRARHYAGATVFRGIMGFGPTSKLHTDRFLELSVDLRAPATFRAARLVLAACLVDHAVSANGRGERLALDRLGLRERAAPARQGPPQRLPGCHHRKEVAPDPNRQPAFRSGRRHDTPALSCRTDGINTAERAQFPGTIAEGAHVYEIPPKTAESRARAFEDP